MDESRFDESQLNTANKVCSLDEAIGFVQAGDEVHLLCSHTRWSAAARALIRKWWGQDPEWTLVMLSLSSLGTLFFRGGLVNKVVTGYSGDVFPNFSPNPRFASAYLSGEVQVEHWSFLSFAQRMEAAARGLPAITTHSLAGSSMETNQGYASVETPFGKVGMLQAYAPDIAVVHGAIADAAGNIAFHPPMLEGVWGALAAKRGVVATVERIVDDIRPWAHLVRIPAHQVLAVTECPLGAHPGGLYGTFTPAEPYGEDLQFWSQAREVSRLDDAEFDAWINKWVLEPTDHSAYLDLLGSERMSSLRQRAQSDSWKAEVASMPPNLEAPANDWERAAIFGARTLADRLVATQADTVLAGAGVANLATWLGAEMARERGAPTVLTAELGLLGYEPTLADPFVFNHRAFPSATMLADSDWVLGAMIPGPATSCIACLGAAQVDAAGNINSTVIPGKVFLVGSGGGNDVATTADEVVIVTTLSPKRTVSQVPYITSPGDRVSRIATELGVFGRRATPAGGPISSDTPFELIAVAAGMEARIRERLGWELIIAEDCVELEPPTPEELQRLRGWDPQGFFLRP
ncbi:MAG: CoA-transferase [Actinomycetes bacterium]